MEHNHVCDPDGGYCNVTRNRVVCVGLDEWVCGDAAVLINDAAKRMPTMSQEHSSELGLNDSSTPTQGKITVEWQHLPMKWTECLSVVGNFPEWKNHSWTIQKNRKGVHGNGPFQFVLAYRDNSTGLAAFPTLEAAQAMAEMLQRCLEFKDNLLKSSTSGDDNQP
jgi:hypothetical protein